MGGEKKCHKCGALNEGNFCLNCGAEIITDTRGLCPSCNNPLAPGNSFCQSCGYNLGENPDISDVKKSNEAGSIPEKQEENPELTRLEIEKEDLRKSISASAGWFYYVAVLSVITTICVVFEISGGFFGSLAVTYFISLIALSIGGAAKFIAFILTVLVSGIYGALGLFATRRNNMAFLVGLILYGLDFLVLFLLLLFDPFNSVIDIIIHGVALYYFYKGLKANKRFHEVEQEIIRICNT